MLESISDFLIQLMEQTGLVGIFLATVVESFFAPVPSEIVLFTAGFYASNLGSFPTLVLIAIVAAFGNFVGTLPFYLVSKYSSEKYLPRFLNRWGAYLLISNRDLERSQKFFDKKGGVTVFFARLIPGIRSLIAFPAGLSKMNFFKYFAFTMAGSFLWNIILGSIGFWAFERKEVFFEIFEPISNIILVGIIALAMLYMARVVYNIRKIRAVR